MSRKTLDPSDITAIIDTREQRPWNLDPLKSKSGTLATGDYSILGLENEIAIERKSLDDLLGCIGQHRKRFDKEIVRLRAYDCRAVIVETTWAQLESGQYRSQISPSAALGSVLGWIASGVPFIFAGDAKTAGTYASRLMYIAARRRWHELQMFYKGLKIGYE